MTKFCISIFIQINYGILEAIELGIVFEFEVVSIINHSQTTRKQNHN